MNTLQEDINGVLGVGTPQVEKPTLKTVFDRINNEKDSCIIDTNWVDAGTPSPSEDSSKIYTVKGQVFLPVGQSVFFRVMGYDKNDSLSNAIDPDVTHSEIVTPDNVAYLIFRRVVGQEYEIKTSKQKESINEYIRLNQFSLEGLSRSVEVYTEWHPSEWFAHGYVNPSIRFSDYIKTFEGCSYEPKGISQFFRVLVFDEYRNQLTNTSIDPNISHGSIIIPEGVRSIVFQKLATEDFEIISKEPSISDYKITRNINTIRDNDKLCTAGDSLTRACKYQKILIGNKNLEWSEEETSYGVDGHAPLAVGGTTIRPIDSNSIYIRSLDIHYYSPNVIILYGGQNDPVSTWKSAGNTGATVEEIVSNEIPYIGGVNVNISTIAAFKGLLQQLITSNPTAKIYLVTQMKVRCDIGYTVTGGGIPFPDIDSVLEFEKNERLPKVEYIKEIGRCYSIPVINLYDNSGINSFNSASFYGDVSADDATQVHPNDLGYKFMADEILKYI